MKRTIFSLLAIVVVAFVFNSCTVEDEFDQALLVGRWQSGTLFEKYSADGTGSTWDTSDDVSEAEAQTFTWTLVKSDLTQIHIMEIGGSVPKYYTVTELTATTLKYHDSFNKSYSFIKISR